MSDHGKSCSVHDHRHRKWRHLDTCQFTTIVEADVPRIIVRSTAA
ncbi:transposase family protein [Klebsiella pneumoniae]|nr:transposase family protein [Klebsiella pneumoniae]MCW9265850.1 transposase family protein [Klebsiella pneumoniae]